MNRRSRRKSKADKGVETAFQTTSQAPTNPFARLAPLAIVIVGLAVYANSLTGPFIFDDMIAIVENPQIRELTRITEVLSPPEDSPVTSRPLVNLSFALNYALGELETPGYHAVNLAIHILAALVLFGVMRRACLSEALRERCGDQANAWALVVSLVWVAHPLSTETVTYVTQRTESLMGLFYLLTVYCAMRSWEPVRERRWSVAAVLACTLGMCSKEVMISAPLIVALCDWVFVPGSFREQVKRRWRLYAGLASTWILLGVLMGTNLRGETIGFDKGISSLDYLMTQAGVIAMYLRLVVWPSPLVITYSDWPVVKSVSEIIPEGLTILVLLGGCIWMLRRRSWVGLAGAWFFLILAPTSSFVPIVTEIAAERRMYLPLVSVVLLGIVGGKWGLGHVFRWFSISGKAQLQSISIIAVLTIVALGYGTLLRNHDYRNAVAIWQDAVQKRPRNAQAQCSLGVALSMDNRVAEAIPAYRMAVNLDPQLTEAWANLGRAMAKTGMWSEAEQAYRKAIELEENQAHCHRSLGVALVKLERKAEAEQAYRAALQIDPNEVDARYNLAGLLAARGEYAEASEHYKSVLRVRSGDAEARFALGNTLFKLGLFDEAVKHYSGVVQLRPRHINARYNLATALRRRGHNDEARRQFETVLKLKPDHSAARTALDSIRGEVGAPQHPGNPGADDKRGPPTE